MPAPVTTDLVWRTMERELFAVLAWVTPGGEARSTGVVYVVHDRKLYVGTGATSWKAKQIAKNPRVAMTVCMARRVPLMPWIQVPDATIALHGVARLLEVGSVDPQVLKKLYRGMEVDEAFKADNVVLEIVPEGDFVTFGVGVSLLTMRRPADARGRAPVVA
jgi:hypothetical protein